MYIISCIKNIQQYFLFYNYYINYVYRNNNNSNDINSALKDANY